jgi:tRNA(Arg) A34 adenosine deaminase TadA
VLVGAGTLVLGALAWRNAVRAQSAPSPRRWYEAAAAMRRAAEAAGDQPYGAVVVLGDAIVGEAPSRVISRGDPNAHAEREAIRAAQARLGVASLAGAVLYSTSRPCAACEDAAARAQVSRMIYGPELTDAGAPRAWSRP